MLTFSTGYAKRAALCCHICNWDMLEAMKGGQCAEILQESLLDIKREYEQ